MAKNQPVATVDEYIKTFSKDVQQILLKLRRTVRKAVPDAVETISYQMPTFKLHGRFLVSFAAWRHHIGLYPIPSGTEAFKREIAQYRDPSRAKSSVRFPIGEPVPYGLVAQLATFRMKETLENRNRPAARRERR